MVKRTLYTIKKQQNYFKSSKHLPKRAIKTENSLNIVRYCINYTNDRIVMTTLSKITNETESSGSALFVKYVESYIAQVKKAYIRIKDVFNK